MAEILITTPADAREVYRHKQLRQALYDAGEVVMEDVLINLHGDDHRQRRRLENRLFRRDSFYEYDLGELQKFVFLKGKSKKTHLRNILLLQL